MTNSPLVSIMIPTYNQAPVVSRAIQSARSQTYQNLEIVVADDSSTDQTQEIVLELQKLDPRIRYFRNAHNFGRVRNYWVCLNQYSKGELVLNVDGDDYLCDEKYIEDAVNLMSMDREIQLVFGRQKYFNSETGKTTEKPNPKLETIMNGDALLFRHHHMAEGIPHISALYRRDLGIARKLQTINLINSDAESMLRLLPKIKVGYIDRIVGVWNQHIKNDSRTLDFESRMESLRMVTEPARFFEENHFFETEKIKSWREAYLLRLIRENICFFLENKSRKLAINFFHEAQKRFGIKLRYSIWLRPKILLRFLAPRLFLYLRRLQ